MTALSTGAEHELFVGSATVSTSKKVFPAFGNFDRASVKFWASVIGDVKFVNSSTLCGNIREIFLRRAFFREGT